MLNDPVHYLCEAERVYGYTINWYFWDEVWTNRIGPYRSEKDCRKALELYYKHLNREEVI